MQNTEGLPASAMPARDRPFLLRAADIVRSRPSVERPSGSSDRTPGRASAASGPSQMGLEDMALFRAIDGAAVLQPSDANQAAQLLGAMLESPGLSYLRVLRGETTVRTPGGRDSGAGAAAR